VLKTSTGTHRFFNHQQTPDGSIITAFYIWSQMSSLHVFRHNCVQSLTC